MPFTPSYAVPEERRAYRQEAGRVGCLMLHGFMGSPASSRPMAAFLAERGITVHCPLLPGHGELLDKMHGIPYTDWLTEAEEALAQLRRQCDEIFIMGHSMGGALAAHLVHEYGDSRDDIRGLILLAPLYKVPSRAIHLLRVLRHLLPWLYPWRFQRFRWLARDRILDLHPDLDLEDPEVLAWLPEATRIPTGAVDEMRKVSDLGRAIWPQLSQPLLILQGEKDIAAHPNNARAIYENVNTVDKALHLFPDAGHELMRPFDPVHEEVWPLVYDFVRRRTRHPLPVPAAESSAAESSGW
ncbi:MAG: alpha/beta fold hydrolase [Candidatus Promineifilaceae bacterium]|nr:alpha/beta fold hydrolase [Candidatus Promineifilaceae bacterium]